VQVREKSRNNVNCKSQMSDFKTQKKQVDELKVEWKLMWRERFNDRSRAEGISVANYASLRVEQGTVIHATRDFKALNFKEILEQHMVERPDRFIQPHPNEGGWRKFIKTKIINNDLKNKPIDSISEIKKNVGQQPKKNGHGWLHTD
jgi:hypothetical protein